MDFHSPSEQHRAFLRRLPPIDDSAADDVPVRLEIDPIQAAAWIEHRLSEEEAAHIEAAMLADPDLLSDLLLVARNEVAAQPSEALLESLCRIGRDETVRATTVVPFARPASPRLKKSVGVWLSWGAVAASVAIISLVGFDLGSMVGKNELSQVTTPDTTQVLNDDLD